MLNPRGLRLLRSLALVAAFAMPASLAAQAQTDKPAADKAQTDKAPTAKPETPNPSADKASTPTPPAATTPPPSTPAPSTPAIKAAPSATPPADSSTPVTPGSKEVPAPNVPGGKDSPAPATKPAAPDGAPDTATPQGKPSNTEIERNGSPGIPDNATTESVNVQAHAAAILPGQSSYDDAFKSIKASLEQLKTSIEKAGLKPSGHALTIFSEPDDKGFKYKLAIPLAAKPDGKVDLGKDITIGETPFGKAIKFQHRGAYEDIDSTYDVITAYLDAKGLQVDNPYIEEYLTDLTTPDDPNLQVDIYVFVK